MTERVVIVGGGLAGLSCAVRCAELGKRVVLLEAGTAQSYLCNSRLAMGFFNVAFCEIGEPADVLRAAADAAGGGTADPAQLDMISGSARPALDWLKGRGVRIAPGTWRRGTRNMLYPPAAVGAGLHWPGRGADQMLRRLEENLTALGGSLRRGMRAISLVSEAGQVRGVICRTPDGEQAVHGDAIVLADGGFQADPALMRAHVTPDPAKVLMRNARTSYGDGLKMALAVGADAVGLEGFYGHLQSRDAQYNNRLWPYPVADHLATGGILVDATGQRIADEGLGGVHLANVVARLDDPLSALAIVDADGWARRASDFPLPANPLMVRHNATIHQGDSLAELASRACVPADALVATVERYNCALRDGTTQHPHRSTDAIPAFPVARAPFYAVPLIAGVTYTTGGVRIDGGGHVMSGAGAAVPGLYAAGSTTGGLEGGPRSGYTGGLTKALVTGWTVANSITGIAA